MSFEKDKKKKLAEYLWIQINKAILNSPEVKFSIKQLQELELLDYVSEYNLVLEVDQLIERIVNQVDDVTLGEVAQLKKDFQEMESSQDPGRKSSGEIKNKNEAGLENMHTTVSKTLPIPWVDGKLLSKNEMLFEEYLDQEFDEDQWMKRTKIRL